MDDGNIKSAIDLSLDRAALLLLKGKNVYKRVMYSCSDEDLSLIGTGVFKKTLGSDVIEYISKSLLELPTRQVQYKTFKEIRATELKLMGFALLVEGYCRQRIEIKTLREENDKLKRQRSEATIACSTKQMRIGFHGLY